MGNDKTFAFKAPAALKKALRETVYKRGYESESDLMRSVIMKFPPVAEELKKLREKTTT